MCCTSSHPSALGTYKKKTGSSVESNLISSSSLETMTLCRLANYGVVCYSRQHVTLHSMTSSHNFGLLNQIFMCRENSQRAVALELLSDFL